MSAKRVEYHQAAIADLKSAVTWYRKHSPKAALDFIDELQKAADTIREARSDGHWERATPENFYFGDFLFRSFIRSRNQWSQF